MWAKSKMVSYHAAAPMRFQRRNGNNGRCFTPVRPENVLDQAVPPRRWEIRISCYLFCDLARRAGQNDIGSGDPRLSVKSTRMALAAGCWP